MKKIFAEIERYRPTEMARVIYLKASVRERESETMARRKWARDTYPTFKVIEDVGNRCDSSRGGLKSIVDAATDGALKTLVLEDIKVLGGSVREREIFMHIFDRNDINVIIATERTGKKPSMWDAFSRAVLGRRVYGAANRLDHPDTSSTMSDPLPRKTNARNGS